MKPNPFASSKQFNSIATLSRELPFWNANDRPGILSDADPVRNDSGLVPVQCPLRTEDRRNTIGTPAQEPRRGSKGNRPFYLHMVATHLIVFNSFGLIQSSVTLSAPYTTHLHKPPSAISWVGSTSIFLTYTLAPLSTHLQRYTSHEHLLLFGAACQTTGLAIAGWSRTPSVTLLFQGVLVGMGHGVTFGPGVARLAKELGASRWKMTALSVAGCGAATGGMAFAALARWAMHHVGLGCTLCVLGGVVGANAVVVQVLLRWRPSEREAVIDTPSRQRGQCGKKIWLTMRVLKEWSFALRIVAVFFVFAGLWIPYFYICTFAVDALHLEPPQSFAVFMILNAAGTCGRIVPALLSDTVLGTVNTYIVVLLLTSTTLLCWPLVSASASMFVWAGAYGFCAGGAVSLVQAGAISLCGGEEEAESILGVVFGVAGVASLVGAPVGGELIKAGEKLFGGSGKSYLLLQMCTAGLMLLGCAASIVARVTKTGWKVLVKI
ncbi:uncharacterized protein EKO05_0003713 [Ascochyta rabiei]|uniref:Transmembrane transport n=1 Tax=Didymella rabiei TaxID=5454 RepID=A0A163KZ28_DIDRA|nr:uncharacterized protein EKO05_0003713 [Ascochyta rabiei]KZM27365.1 transmembrane transport [Ascochyta rabiei]UPX13190.1 hypothetical protein EKO05_0003713 [Ascochyta rabiei]